jgi:hypothetical protein
VSKVPALKIKAREKMKLACICATKQGASHYLNFTKERAIYKLAAFSI